MDAKDFKSRLLKTDVQPREYQTNIALVASEKNTLCVLPTGMGKTLISVLVAAKRLDLYPSSKVLICSPTRPLSAQHKKSFEEFTNIGPEEIILLTGKIAPADRIALYSKAKIIIATPQTIENDLEAGRLSLENFSFVTLDEAHRSVKEYSYPFIAKKFMLQSKHPLILGLTASPGASAEKIKEICDNLFIKAVEIRSENDEDVQQYVQDIQRESVYVELPEEFKKIKLLLGEVLKDDLYWLKEHHYTFTYTPTKKMLLDLQRRAIASYMHGSKGAYWAIVRCAGAVKVQHAVELLETQGVGFLYDYLKKLEASKKKTDVRIMKDPRLREASNLAAELHAKGIEHPKLEKIMSLVKDLLKNNPAARIIIFASFRSTVDRINQLMKDDGIKSDILIGQAIKEGKGLTQEQQIETLKRFADKKFNVLCGTQISEEGISIPDVEFVIFYESVASEIRAIQRRGRTGRTSAGKVIFLVTKDTTDEAYFFASLRKEKKMKSILYGMKGKELKRRKTTLVDWVR